MQEADESTGATESTMDPYQLPPVRMDQILRYDNPMTAAVRFARERTCCDESPEKIRLQSKARRHYDSGTGTWVRCSYCGKVNWLHRNEQ